MKNRFGAKSISSAAGSAGRQSDAVRWPKATLAGGCFWCLEAVYQEVKGIERVISGYSGGSGDSPNFDKVHMTNTGHAEAVQITFDSEVISYSKILEIFYSIHDPTTLNKQGYDVGEEYRSVIFYHDAGQKKTAEEVTENYAAKIWSDPIVTQIVPYEKFWPAEDYHQNFYRDNPNIGYCRVIINPKLEKFNKQFKDLLK
ncbi:MAG TPA: peptide-methionine (S)-S-oxide reductase MsrA [Candidatus Saccharimonadales bacterium]|nr:peptide-methionine (S)-S-oxide reductase MsrA [Candidatus Saccharimonadales bacterium]